MYLEELSRQLALDYCCSPADVADSKKSFYNPYTTGRTSSFSGKLRLRFENCCRQWEIIGDRFGGNCDRVSETLC